MQEEPRTDQRQLGSRPDIEDAQQWPRILPCEGIGDATGCALRRWTELERYTTDGRLKIDNNLAVNAMRNIAIGRKSWLCAQSDEGGRRAAIRMVRLQRGRSQAEWARLC